MPSPRDKNHLTTLHYVQKGATFSLLHRVSATRYLIIQHLVGLPIIILIIVLATLHSQQRAVFIPLIVICWASFVCMKRTGFYDLSSTIAAHNNAAKLYDDLLLSLTAPDIALKELGGICIIPLGDRIQRSRNSDVAYVELDVAFERIRTSSPIISESVLWWLSM